MTVTARYLAWLHGFKPSARQHLALAAMETSLLIAWAFLLDSMLRFATNSFLSVLPLTFLIAANLLAWLEDPSVSVMADPMTAEGLAEVGATGRKPPRWRTLLRLLMTPPTFLVAIAGFLPVLRGRRSLAEVAAGVRLVSLDPLLDPRPIEQIMARRKRNRRTVLGYTLLSLSTAVLILLLPAEAGPSTGRVEHAAHPGGLDQHDRQLLSTYLDMSMRYPDSLEFHVRLASLYFRNSMQDDLASELDAIQRLDPDNPMLLLREDMHVDEPELTAPGDSFPAIDGLGFGPPPRTTSGDSLAADTSAVDTMVAPPEGGPPPSPEEASGTAAGEPGGNP